MSLISETDALFFGQTDLDKAFVARLVNDTLGHVDDGELFLEHRESEAFVWDDGCLRIATSDSSSGFGFRAIVGEAVAYAHASDLSQAALLKAVPVLGVLGTGARDVDARVQTKEEARKLYSSANPLLSKSFDDKVLLLETIDAYVRAQDPRIIQVSVSLSSSWQSVQIMRVDAEAVADVRPMVSLRVSLVIADGERRETGSDALGGRADYSELFDDEQWQAMVKGALRQARISMEAVPAPAGEMTVVLAHGWPSVLIHEAVGHGLEGDFNRKKTSVFSGSMGEQVAAKGVTIVDDGSIAGYRGSLSVDDEGTTTQRNVLIDDGVLVGYMQDRMNARLMGGVSTGNGRRESFEHQPYPRMTNTMLMNGAYTHDEIIESVSNGLYAADFGGGQVDITSGNFVFSATEAYLIEDGKITQPVKGASLVGTGIVSMKNVTMIGDDFYLKNSYGHCGKQGQTIPVGNGQPTLKIENMTVGGL